MDLLRHPAKVKNITNNLPSSVITYIFDSINVIDRNDFKRRALAAMPATQKITADASESIYSHSQLLAGFCPDGSRFFSLISITKLKAISKYGYWWRRCENQNHLERLIVLTHPRYNHNLRGKRMKEAEAVLPYMSSICDATRCRLQPRKLW